MPSLSYDSVSTKSEAEIECYKHNDSVHESYQHNHHREQNSTTKDEEEQFVLFEQSQQKQQIKPKRPSFDFAFPQKSSAFFLFFMTFVAGVATGTFFFHLSDWNTNKLLQNLYASEDDVSFGWMSLETLIQEDDDMYPDDEQVSSRPFLDYLPHESFSIINAGDKDVNIISRHVPRYRSGPPLLYLRNELSYNLLYDQTIRSISQYSSDYFLITTGWDTQINQAYCGPASVAALLNSLRFGGAFGPVGAGGSVIGGSVLSGSGATVALPVDAAYSPYKYATQNSLFGSCTSSRVIYQSLDGEDGLLIPPYGLNLAQVTKMLQCHFLPASLGDTSSSSSSSSMPSSSSSNSATLSDIEDDDAILTENSDFSVKLTYLDKTHVTLGKMRFDLRTALKDQHSRILIGYDRKLLGQVGGGHISPVGSYHAPSDSFLIMDVSKYKYPPVWVPAAALYEAMAAQDECGTWNFPQAQSKLTDEMKHPYDNKKDDDNGTDSSSIQGTEWYELAMKVLGCKSMPRGYIVVKRD